MKHKCGCITEKDEKGIVRIQACKGHLLNKKWIWVALQHEEIKPARMY